MFGDDTWLSLFGGEEGEEPIFSVSEGTTSFFVSDTGIHSLYIYLFMNSFSYLFVHALIS